MSAEIEHYFIIGSGTRKLAPDTVKNPRLGCIFAGNGNYVISGFFIKCRHCFSVSLGFSQVFDFWVSIIGYAYANHVCFSMSNE